MSPSSSAFKEIRIQQFRSFAVAARIGNLSAAARELGLSRPALWQQLRSLERDFEADFFSRRRHGVELTEDGRLFLELTAPLLAGFDGLKSAFDERRGRRALALRVAFPAGLRDAEFEAAVASFRKSRPDVAVETVEVPAVADYPTQRRGEAVSALAMVTAGQVHLALEADPPEPRDPRLHFHRVTERELFLAGPRTPSPSPSGPAGSASLPTRKPVSPADLAGRPFVMEPPGGRLRARIGAVFAAAGLTDRWRVVLETTDEGVLLETVACGLALSVIARQGRKPVHPEVRLLPAGDLFGSQGIFLVSRSVPHEPEHLKAFREALTAAYRNG